MGISLVSATQPFDKSAVGKLNENMLSMFAQFDNDSKSERTITGMKNRALKGLWISTAPWGYLNTGERTEDKMIIPDKDKAPIVKMLFEKYVTGKYTFKELALMANKIGIKSKHGLRMTKQTVAKIISNPVYCGKVVVPKFDVSVDGKHDAIISEKLFLEAEALRAGKGYKKLSRSRDNPKYPIRGMRCGGCSKNISGGDAKGRGKYYPYYGCVNSECPKKTSLKKDEYEKEFTDLLSALTPSHFYLEGLAEAIKISHKKQFESITAIEKKFLTEIAELDAKKSKLMDLMIEGKIQSPDFTIANEKCNMRISYVKRELAELSSPELGIEKIIDEGIEFVNNLPHVWKTLNVKDLRVLKTLLFPQNLTYEYPGFKTAEVCCIYSIKSEFLSQKTHQVPPPGIEPRIAA